MVAVWRISFRISEWNQGDKLSYCSGPGKKKKKKRIMVTKFRAG